MRYAIESVTLPEQPAIALHDEVPRDKIGEWLGGAYEKIFTCLGQAGIQPVGPPFARFQFLDDRVDAEAGVPVAAPVDGQDGFSSVRLPSGTAAVTVHVGPYDTLDQAYQALRKWIAEQGYETAGPWWEEYLTGPSEQADPAAQCTRVVMPYRIP
jgi:effector-binding domain-containing protein